MEFLIQETNNLKSEAQTTTEKNVLLQKLAPAFKKMKVDQEIESSIEYEDYSDTYTVKRIA